MKNGQFEVRALSNQGYRQHPIFTCLPLTLRLEPTTMDSRGYHVDQHVDTFKLSFLLLPTTVNFSYIQD